jgi:hypothetical protein
MTMISHDKNDKSDLTIKFLNQQCPSVKGPHIMKLKVGPFIMLLRNMHCKKELLNGTRFVVKGLQAHFVDAGITSS